MATQPQFAATARIGVGQVSTANTNRDGTGTVVVVMPAQSTDTVINSIRLKASGQTAASTVTIFLHDGTNFRILTEVAVSAVTPSTTVASFDSGPIAFDDLVLPTNWSLRAAITVAPVSGVVNVEAFGGSI